MTVPAMLLGSVALYVVGLIWLPASSRSALDRRRRTVLH